MTATSQKIAIVTGANNGIGFETTIGIAEAGFHVVMACRNLEKAKTARDDVLARVPSASLDVMPLDLGDFASVRSFAEAFRARYSKLDVLINNAGILLYTAETNGDGIELQFATNHLGHFLLTALLIDLVPDDPASRIVALSSLGHKGATIQFDDLTCGQDGGIAYGQSKLANLLFGDELNRRLRASGRRLKALSVHPGGSESGLFHNVAPDQLAQMKAQVEQFLHSPEEAAKPTLYAALSTDVQGGDYYGPTGPQEMSGEVGVATRDPITANIEIATRLWTLSEVLTGQSFKI
ncbi:oxidoreductase [Ruegeria lacuscaerulensis]|uniref:oxidoreductase n=1 Tax=Ruegeria lacuscaerulensis TaxID=55218 RepID=UPI00147FA456|nr:oxidoreductase [Ruegeria lacuscaerulensis]